MRSDRLTMTVRTRRRTAERDDERGFVLVWFAVLIVLLLSLAAFTIDIINGYAAANRVQNAADAAALGGVVALPSLDDADPIARELAEQNAPGIDPATVLVERGELPTQLRVRVTEDIDTFFAGVFGITEITVTRSATAEYEPPVAMGSPRNTFGNRPGSGDADPPAFWATAGGPVNAKQNGNAAMFEWCDDSAQPGSILGGAAPADNCATGTNRDYEGSQYFVIEVRDPGASQLTVDLFDPAFMSTAEACGNPAAVGIDDDFADARYDADWPSTGVPPEFCAGDVDARFQDDDQYTGTAAVFDDSAVQVCPDYFTPTEFDPNNPAHDDPTDPDYEYRRYFNGDPALCNLWRLLEGLGPSTLDIRPVDTTFTLFDDDNSDFNPYDNDDVLCTETYFGHASPWLALSRAPADFNNWFHQWVALCDAAIAGEGSYILRVDTSGRQQGNNNFSIAATTTGNRYTDPNVSIYAVERMGIFTNQSSDTGSFYLARVLPAGIERTLKLSFFDIGDAFSGGNTSVSIVPTADVGLEDGDGNPATNDPWSMECRWGAPSGAVRDETATDDDGPLSPWELGSTFWGAVDATGGDCSVDNVNESTHQGRWISVDVTIPEDYRCAFEFADGTSNPEGCWLQIQFDTPSNVIDTTTWTARIEGNPVRIVE